MKKKKKSKKTPFLVIISLVVLVHLSVTLFLYVSQRSLIYFPSESTAEAPDGVLKVSYKVKGSGDELHKNWYVPPLSYDKQIILHFHGNAGSIDSRYNKMLPYIQQGYGVMLSEYPGYGGNPGAPSEESFFEGAENSYRSLINLGYEPQEIILYGESIGAGSATYLAQKYEAKALVLEVPFDSLLNVVKGKYPFILGMKYLLKDHFDNLSRIADVNMPVLVMLAEKDEVIPTKFGENLYNKASEPKQLEILKGLGHNNVTGNETYPIMRDFIAKQ
tara:strand:+ start:333119 stop:333943 length:825 start_codon:yes stop_codon:yes gene_type:complete